MAKRPTNKPKKSKGKNAAIPPRSPPNGSPSATNAVVTKAVTAPATESDRNAESPSISRTVESPQAAQKGQASTQPVVEAKAPPSPATEKKARTESIVEEKVPAQPAVEGRASTQPVVEAKAPPSPATEKKAAAQPIAEGKAASQEKKALAQSAPTPILPVPSPADEMESSLADQSTIPVDSPTLTGDDFEQSTLDKSEAEPAASEAESEALYLEPQTPFIVPLPAVAQAESISPHLPSETLEQRSSRVSLSGGQEYPSGPEEPGPVSVMPMHDDSMPQHDQPGPNYPHMYVVHITPELAPLAKVGGLADVVTGLSRELERRGHNIEIILPKYDCMHYDHVWGLSKSYDDLWVPWYNGHVHCTVWFGHVHDRKCFFIEPHSPDNFFNRGSIYGFSDDILRFAFFSRAALEFLWKAGKHPDVIHCHDWQTALVPVFLYEIYQKLGMGHPRVCFTIHNFKHQGLTGDFLLSATGLHRPDYYFHNDRLQDNHTPHALNLMKGGIVYSNFITTVSPRYAGETKDGGQGFGLEPTLHRHHYKFGGVVNGIDYDFWNPEIDPHIATPFTAGNIDHKYVNKRALRQRLLLADNEKPIIAFVGRLDPQKGLDLVRHALFYSLNHRAQFVLLGSSPERDINGRFWELKRQLNDSPDCHIEVGFDEGLAHLIYAGADMIVVPSLFEPCGLTQLIAMKYGTIPIVREVGGLADTVFDKDHAHHKALHERNGYVFRDYNNQGLESALSRAIDCYFHFPEHFRELIKNAMGYDYSWKYPGQHYLNIYDYIRNK